MQQEKAYESKEVRLKLADLLVALNRYYDANVDSVAKMLDELEVFLQRMHRDYFPELWDEVSKLLGDRHKRTTSPAEPVLDKNKGQIKGSLKSTGIRGI